jgi:hypothetical protein
MQSFAFGAQQGLLMRLVQNGLLPVMRNSGESVRGFPG